MVRDPQAFLLDEPLSNLDAKLRRQVRADIRALQQSLGLTVVYVTHDQSEALAVSDQVIVMSRARISQIGSPRELYDAPGNDFIADFIGDSNLIKGELQSGANGRFFVAQTLRAPVPDDTKLPDGAVCMSVRPQKWRIQAEGACVGDDWICVPGVLGKGAYLGSHMEWLVQTEHGELLVIDGDTRTQQNPDSAVLLCVNKDDVRWVVSAQSPTGN